MGGQATDKHCLAIYLDDPVFTSSRNMRGLWLSDGTRPLLQQSLGLAFEPTPKMSLGSPLQGAEGALE
jgi:hypothetical protein